MGAGKAAAGRAGAFVEATIVPMGPAGWEARAEGILWKDGQIRLVGTSGEVRVEARRLSIEVESLDGRLVLPGFVDAHTHFLHVGVKTTRPDLRGSTSLQDALGRTARWLAAHPGSGPVIAEGWDESEWRDGRRPTRDDVDALVAAAAKDGHGPLDRPVVLRRICGHIAVAGSGALPLVWARWDDDAAVDRRTGLLLEAPSLYLNEVLPSTPEQLDRAVQEACREAHRLGVTAVGDYSQAPYRAALQRAAAGGRLTVRVASSIYIQQLEAESAAGFRTGRAAAVDPAFAGWLHDGGVKVFLDGSLGGHTALLREPYLDWKADGAPAASATASTTAGAAGKDDHAGHGHASLASGGGSSGPGPRGQRVWTDEELDRHFGTAHAAGVQIHAHAIGDGAIDQGLEAYHRLATRADLEGKGWDGNALRHRFEHFEIAHDDQVARASELRLVSSSQPNFVGEWSAKGGMYQARLGERFLLNNRFRTFKETSLPLAFGSDGMPFGPLVGLQAAVAHPDPRERLDSLEAAWHYTWMAAWSLHWEDLGHLAPGKPADLVVLDGDASGPPKEWSIHETISGGVTRAFP
ncbi:MAG TPA: amidohydrolase family protein [Candidatus Thermoplasmatota archaeon]|nr:amidohydrolase family protein [Candidatus Thermoplasmatota archaeon]